MRVKPMLTLYKKEIMDLLRDKKTIIVMILVPILLYPSMMLISLLVMQGVVKDSAEKEYRIAMVESDVRSEVEEVLFEGAEEKSYHFKCLSYPTEEKAKADLSSKNVDLVIVSYPSEMNDKSSELFGDETLFRVKSTIWQQARIPPMRIRMSVRY